MNCIISSSQINGSHSSMSYRSGMVTSGKLNNSEGYPQDNSAPFWYVGTARPWNMHKLGVRARPPLESQYSDLDREWEKTREKKNSNIRSKDGPVLDMFCLGVGDILMIPSLCFQSLVMLFQTPSIFRCPQPELSPSFVLCHSKDIMPTTLILSDWHEITPI